MAIQSCCSDAVCGWKPLVVTPPHVATSHKGEMTGIGVGCSENARLGGLKDKLNPLIAREPQGINAIGDEEWVEIELAIDSGATETDMSERTLAVT